MNRRRKVKPDLGFGTVVLLIVTAVVMAAAGVFHAYLKNRQIKVARELQGVEDRISQCKLDITTLEIRLDDQLNPILLKDRLMEMSSDLRRIPQGVVEEVPAFRGEVPVAVPPSGSRDSPPVPSASLSTVASGS
ncbi:MAG: hypothetical protein VX633_05950 [Verrucomicrobiota bacterium]|nr:hypothetical protein [Verrucomicrobiota bacterium]